MANTLQINEAVLTEGEFQRVSALVYRHCGINLHEGKRELVRARLEKRLRALGLSTIGNYLDFVDADESGEEFTAMIDSISTNLTSFFRENQHFVYLGERLLPQLLERKRNAPIRGWSAACSSGEEAYTIAITVREAAKSTNVSNALILATDISTRVLRTAMGGVYDEERIKPVPESLRRKYFTTERSAAGKRFTVTPSIRDMVRFRHLNLVDQWPFTGPFDFIFCRNVMIYFDKQTQERLVNRFHDCLDTGGVLFTGHSESLTGVEHKFKYVEPTIYQKV